jgi:hypothetical protein
MSDEQRTEDEAEIEAHRKKHMANDEPSDDAGSDDDFEAHRLRKTNARLD